MNIDGHLEDMNSTYNEIPSYRSAVNLATNSFMQLYADTLKKHGYTLKATPVAIDDYNYVIMLKFGNERRFRWPWDSSLRKFKRELPEKYGLNVSGREYFIVCSRDAA